MITAQSPVHAGADKLITVAYGSPLGDDIKFVGSGDGSRNFFSEQFNIKVGYVKPGGIAEASGAKVGDVLLQFMVPKAGGTPVAAWSRPFGSGYANKNANEDIMNFLAQQLAAADADSKPEVQLVLRPSATLQPGDQAPSFKLTNADADDTSLDDVLKGRKHAVIAFRPGLRFGTDKAELKAFEAARQQLESLDAAVVSISTDDPGLQNRLVSGYGLSYKLLTDQGGDVAKSFGAAVNLPGGLGATPMRTTFIVGSNRQVERTFPLPWDGNRNDMENHLDDVVLALGGEPRDQNAPQPGSVGAVFR